MENRIVVTICDQEYTLVAEESASYMQKVGSYVSEKMEGILTAARVGRTDAAVLTAVNLADELFKEQAASEALRVQIQQALAEAGKAPHIAAIDISRDSAKAVARRPFAKQAVVASAFRLPVLPESCDLILDIFAPCAAGEFARVLRPGGVLLRAVPLPRHLFGLKAAIYEKPYENSPIEQALPGFESIARRDLCWTLTLDTPQKIDELFKMTPYYYKTSPADQAKVAALPSLSTELAFAVLADRKL